MYSTYYNRDNFDPDHETVIHRQNCYAIEPGYQQFPTRCKLPHNHKGPHKSWADYGTKQFLAEWEDE